MSGELLAGAEIDPATWHFMCDEIDRLRVALLTNPSVRCVSVTVTTHTGSTTQYRVERT